jgi:lipoprotein-releasing system permease protein
MRYEAWIGLRYLVSIRDARRPSIITLISVAAVAVGVAALIVVLAVHGGFEGDLRNKILATKAHLLVTGAHHGPLNDPEPVLAAVDGLPHVLGAAPFIESELLVSSRTNYTGVVLRGIDLARVGDTSDLPQSIVDGEFNWLNTPDEAIDRRPRRLGQNEDLDEVMQRLQELELEIAEMERRSAASGEASGAEPIRWPGAAQGGTPNEGSALAPTPRRSGAMPGLPAPGTTAEELQQAQQTLANGPADGPIARVVPEGSGQTAAPAPAPARSGAMPALPAPGTTAEALQAEQDALLEPGDRPAQPLPGLEPPPPVASRVLPGVILGIELLEMLHVQVGDVVELVSPDGPIGPTGPTPTVRRFRVVATFYTGLYEYDSHMAYVLLDEARSFLRMNATEVTGVEVRVDVPDRVEGVRVALDAALQAAALPEAVESRDWKQLNASLFEALMLEKFVIGLLVMIIVLVASFAIVCVLIMVVIQKGPEIAILRTMGATHSGIVSIFVAQGTAIGVLGTTVGATFGLGLVWFAQTQGIPLDPDVYYIDKVPLEIGTGDVIAILVGAVASSMLATLYPSVQAARLHPAAGLRYELQ